MKFIRQYPHLAARVFGAPLLLHPQKLDAIIAGLGSRLMGLPDGVELRADGMADGAQLLPAELFTTRKGERTDAGYRVSDGVAYVPVHGALVHRGRMEADSSYLLGYNDVGSQVEAAMADGDVNSVVLGFDSPGGEAQGAFELADRLMSLRGRKPMVAVADGMAASAAYLAASAADQVVITSTGYAGSIGVVMRHANFSRALIADGVDVEHFYAGAHKIDGNPYEPLTAAARADMQAEVNKLYDMFIASVSRQRGLDPEAVRQTQARVYRGETAVSMRLADRLGTTDQIIAELAAQRPRSFSVGQTARTTATTGDSTMAQPQAGGQLAAPGAQAPQQTIPATTDPAQARAEGHAAGVQAERERTGAILGHERASANLAVALTCVNTGLSAEQAGQIMASLPASVQAAPITPPQAASSLFAAAMSAVGNPAISGIEPGAASAGTEQESLAAQVLATFRANTR